MQCADCHFQTDVHGNGLLYGEPRAATTIECIDCHGTINARPTLVTSGAGGQIDLRESNTPWGPRFFWQGNNLYQRSTMRLDLRWEVPQTVDTIDPKSPHYNAKSAYAKTLRRDGTTWGDVPSAMATDVSRRTDGQTSEDSAALRRPLQASACARELAHDNSNISCQICHSSWATACFGCHLPMRANQRVALNKYEGITTRNYTTYNPQVVRDDAFQLGIDATYKNHRLAVLRSSSAVVVES